MNRRLMGALAARTFGPAPLDQNPAGDALALDFSTPPVAPTDGDGDGMPDDWELANGLAPANPADGNATGLSVAKLGVTGYTNLEVYLDELARKRIATP
jgi:hypothetical protein